MSASRPASLAPTNPGHEARGAATGTGPGAPGAGLHLLVPWASSLSEACLRQLPQLDNAQAFSHLHGLLRLLPHRTWLHGDEFSPHTPHERCLARALGWPHAEHDPLPWAARQAQADDLAEPQTSPPGTLAEPESVPAAWGLLTPCHWRIGHDHLTLIHPSALALSRDESQALFEAVATLFTDDGWALHWGAPTRWYATHDSLAELPTASLDRVIGRNPDVWLPDHPQARRIKRLQSEVQMLLYQHPVNQAREARGQLSVNSFWLSGCGRPAPATRHGTPTWPMPQVADGMRDALLNQDAAAWLAAWQTLEHTWLAQAHEAALAGQPVSLSLCGERHAITLSTLSILAKGEDAPTEPAHPWWRTMAQAVSRAWRPVPAPAPDATSALLASL